MRESCARWGARGGVGWDMKRVFWLGLPPLLVLLALVLRPAGLRRNEARPQPAPAFAERPPAAPSHSKAAAPGPDPAGAVRSMPASTAFPAVHAALAPLLPPARARLIEDSTDGAAGAKIRYSAEHVVIKLARQTSEREAAEFLAWHNLERAATPEGLSQKGYIVARIADRRAPRAVLERIARARGPAVHAEPLFVLSAMGGTGGDPAPGGLPWHAVAAGFDRAWPAYRPRGAAVLALVDTGVNRAIPRLRDACLEGHDFVRGAPGAEDDHGHGTFLAGLIARGAEDTGAFGLWPGARILPLKALDASGSGWASDVAAAVLRAADEEARVILIAAGSYAPSAALLDAIAYAAERGCLVIAPTGNDGIAAPAYPAAWPSVLAVGALGRRGGIWPASNRGPHVDAAAPGEEMLSLDRQGRPACGSGTSAAAAVAAALAAMLCDRHPDWAPAAIRTALLASARDLAPPGRDEYSGAGALDAGAALAAARREVRDVSIVRAEWISEPRAAGSGPLLAVWLRNGGTDYEERADVQVWLNGRLAAERKNAAARGDTRIEFELPPFAASAARCRLRILAIPLGEDADPGNNEFRLSGTARYDGDRRLFGFLKDRPFVHSWVALQGYNILPDGPLKTEMSPYLWGGATYDDLFGDGVRWEEDVEDLDDPSWWSSESGSGACVLEGAYEEDDDNYGIDLVGSDSFMNHFWDPDQGYDYGVEKVLYSGRHHSALWRAHQWWNRARREYSQNGDKAMAFYCLGRIAHLLADMSTPEHVHNDIHPSDDTPAGGWMSNSVVDSDDFSNYEEYTKIAFRNYPGSGEPVRIPDLPLALPPDYAPSDFDADFSRLFYNLAQYAQLFDSSDVNGNSVGYGGGVIVLGRPAEAGGARKTFPALAYLDGRGAPRVDLGTVPTVRWQKLGWTGWYTYKTLLPGPTIGEPNHYYELSRGEGVLGMPSSLWSAMGPTDRIEAVFTYRGSTYTDHIFDFDTNPAKPAYAFVPDRFAGAQADDLMPRAIRYTAALYQLFWRRVYPPPETPASLQASDSTSASDIHLTWSSAAGAASYRVYRANAAGGPYESVAETADCGYTDSGLAPGTTRWYRVKALRPPADDSDFSPFAMGRTAWPPPVPQNVAAGNQQFDNLVRVTWTDGERENQYHVYRADTVDGAYQLIASVGPNVTTYDDPRPAGAVWFYYKVRASNVAGYSDYSPAASGRTRPNAENYPKWLQASDGTEPTGVRVSWDAVSGASDYLLYRALAFHGPYSLRATIAAPATEYYDELGSSGLTCWYYVVARFPDTSLSAQSSRDSGYSGISNPWTPVSVTASDGAHLDRVRVAWSLPAGSPSADFFEVYRASQASGSYACIGSTTATVYDDALAPGSAVWFYKIKAVNQRGASALSAADSGYTAPPPPPPASLTASDGTYWDRIRVEWTPVAGASGYTLERAASAGGPYSGLVSVSGATPWYEDDAPPDSGLRYYRVITYAGGQASAPSAADSGFTSPAPPPAPGGVQASDGTYFDRIRVTWGAAAGAERYRIERSEGGAAPYLPRGETGAGVLAFEDPALRDSAFLYRVIAVNVYGESDPGGPDAGATNPGPPPPPEGVAASDGAYADRLRIQWSEVGRDVEVAVFESESPNGPFEIVSDWLPSDTTSIERMSGDIRKSHLYYYRLRARNEFGESDWSAADSGWIGRTPRTVAKPTLTPPGGLFAGAVEVVVGCATAGAEIHYTTDGAAPDPAGPGIEAGGVIRIAEPTRLRARAWKEGSFPSEETEGYFAATGDDRVLIALGDVEGRLMVLTAPGGKEIARWEGFKAPVASVRVFDADGDGEQDIVALPRADAEEPAICFDLLLREKWRTKVPCGLLGAGRSNIGCCAQAADVDGDGNTEVILPYETAPGEIAVRVVSGRTGETLDYGIEPLAACPVLHFDPAGGRYRLAAARHKDGDVVPGAYDLHRRDWAWTDAGQRVARTGAHPRAWWDGAGWMAALWGGIGREVAVWADDGRLRWRRDDLDPPRVGATAHYVADLDGGGHPALLVEGEFQDVVALEALRMKDGQSLWQWSDPDARRFARVLGLGRRAGEPDPLLVVWTGGDPEKETPPRLHGIRGADGQTMWSVPLEHGDELAREARVRDVDAPDKPRVLVAVNHRIEGIDAKYGSREFAIAGAAAVTSFDLAAGFMDSDGDGERDWAEEVAGTNPQDSADRLRIVRCEWTGGGPRIAWPAVAGHYYEILVSEDLRRGFQVLMNNVLSQPPLQEQDLPPPAGRQIFYRVRVHE